VQVLHAGPDHVGGRALGEGRAHSDDEVREQMSSLCRCGAYPNIIATIRRAPPRGRRSAKAKPEAGEARKEV
jgi:hypothetical protein